MVSLVSHHAMMSILPTFAQHAIEEKNSNAFKMVKNKGNELLVRRSSVQACLVTFIYLCRREHPDRSCLRF